MKRGRDEKKDIDEKRGDEKRTSMKRMRDERRER